MSDPFGVDIVLAAEHMSRSLPTNIDKIPYIDELPGTTRVALRVTIQPGQGAKPHYHPASSDFDADQVEVYMQVSGRALAFTRESGKQVWTRREMNGVNRNVVVRPRAYHAIFVPRIFGVPFVMMVSTLASHAQRSEIGRSTIYLSREVWPGTVKTFWPE